MQECCIRFSIFYKFSQIRRNDNWQSGQLKVTFHLKPDYAAVEDINHMIRLDQSYSRTKK